MTKNSKKRPLSTIFMPCLKIQGRGTALPAADVHVYVLFIEVELVGVLFCFALKTFRMSYFSCCNNQFTQKLDTLIFYKKNFIRTRCSF